MEPAADVQEWTAKARQAEQAVLIGAATGAIAASEAITRRPTMNESAPSSAQPGAYPYPYPKVGPPSATPAPRRWRSSLTDPSRRPPPTPPLPPLQWPVHHSSAAFDAVAVKKSMILSPAENFAEIAHHGERGQRLRVGRAAL
jgi:hypothetical protein